MRLRMRHEGSGPFCYEAAVTENASPRGLCLWCRLNLPMHEKVYVETADKLYRAVARVVWSRSEQGGLFSLGLRVLLSKGKIAGN